MYFLEYFLIVRTYRKSNYINSIYNRLLLNILYVINQKYGLNL